MGGFGGEWYDLLQPYIKNFGVVFCPDRTLVDAGDKKYEPYNSAGIYYEPGYGYDDGFVSDSGFGLTSQLKSSSGQTYRPGKNLSEIVSSADMVSRLATATIRAACLLRWTIFSAVQTVQPELATFGTT